MPARGPSILRGKVWGGALRRPKASTWWSSKFTRNGQINNCSDS